MNAMIENESDGAMLTLTLIYENSDHNDHVHVGPFKMLNSPSTLNLELHCERLFVKLLGAGFFFCIIIRQLSRRLALRKEKAIGVD